MQFKELRDIVKKEAQHKDFQTSSTKLQELIFGLKKELFIPIVSEIGAIPEDIKHDSTEEKLYTKLSDIVLAKCFIELGLKAMVLKERANCADVIAKSQFHNYTLVADAKAFRLSRTAKNQKDFKIESMVHWKGDNDYSVLCCPYFQYLKSKSQIFLQALNGNVNLFSWEYFSILLKKDIKESEKIDLSSLWNYSEILARQTTVKNSDSNFLEQQNKYIMDFINCSEKEFLEILKKLKSNIVTRGNTEIKYWQNEISAIKKYSREQAIDELIKSLKLNEKINAISLFMKQLRD